MLEIDHLTKRFGDKTAVDDLTLHIAPGEVYGFIGHNGAGKTTTIKCAVGIMQPDAGTVTIDGRSLAEDPKVCKSKLAYIPDNPDLYDYMSGIKFLNFIGDVFYIPPAERRARLAQGFELAVERVSFANEHVPPPLGTLDAGGAEYVQELGAELGRVTLEILSHRIERRLARSHHLVADLLLLVQAVALRRVQAEVCSEVRHFLGLSEFGHLCFVHHLSDLLSMPSTVNGGAGVVRIPLQIIRKGAFSSVEKWCADFSNASLLT